jgi:hypothetical protein
MRKELEMNKNVKYSEKMWLELELNFLKEHKYFTSSAKVLS